MRRLTIAASLVVTLAMLAACGGGSGGTEATTTSSSSTSTLPATTTTTVAAAPCGGAGALPPAVQASPVAGINEIPTSSYTVDVQALTGDGQYAKFALVPTPAAASTLQGGYGVAHCVAGVWTVVDFGSSDVGCPGGTGEVPGDVRAALGLECTGGP